MGRALIMTLIRTLIELAFLASYSGGNTKGQAVKLPEQSTASSTVINGKLMLAMDPLPRGLSFLIL